MQFFIVGEGEVNNNNYIYWHPLSIQVGLEQPEEPDISLARDSFSTQPDQVYSTINQ